MALKNVKNPYSNHTSLYDDGLGDYGEVRFSQLHNNNIEVPDPSEYLFGTRSKKYKSSLNQYNHDMERYKWDAELAIMADDREYAEEIYNKYNSPDAQVRQMREAGLNPDLQGVQSSGMNAPQSSSPQTGVPSMVNDNQSLGFDFLMAIPQAVSMFTGMASSLQSLKEGKLNLASQIDNIALDYLGGILTPESISGDSFDNTLYRFASKDARKIHVQKLAPKYGKRMAKRISNSISNFILNDFDSVKQSIYNKRFSGEKSRQGFLGLLSNFGFSLDDDIFVDVVKEFNNISKNALNNKNKFDSDYWSKRNGIEAGDVDNSVKSKQGMRADNDIYTELMSKANKKMNSKDSKEVAVGVLMYLALMLTNAKLSQNGLHIQE